MMTRKYIKKWKNFLNESLARYEHEYDEEVEMHIIKPSSLNLLASNYNEVVGDYDPIQPLFDIEKNIPFWINEISDPLESIGIPDIIILLAEPYEGSHIASVVDGTESSVPIFCLDIDSMANFEIQYQRDIIIDSILHEAGHVYIRNRGIEYQPSEEDVVERYARTQDKSLLDDYISQNGQ